jgi:hypothetical protein
MKSSVTSQPDVLGRRIEHVGDAAVQGKRDPLTGTISNQFMQMFAHSLAGLIPACVMLCLAAGSKPELCAQPVPHHFGRINQCGENHHRALFTEAKSGSIETIVSR